ncbi:Gfo/Idh/MocA family protein [Streptomyces nigrescens]
MKVAIVGFGTAGGARLSGYRSVPGADVAAIVEPAPERRRVAAEQLPYGRVVASLDELLAQGGIDVVDVCTPPAYHVPLAHRALTAGCHVICEKPVAVSLADAQELIGTARSHGRLLYPSHNYGTSPMMRLLRQAVDGGIGRLESARFQILRDRHARGVRGFRPDWRRSRELAGGGILLDHGTHCVYMALRLFGELPAKISCTVGRPEGAPDAVDEEAAVRMDFGSAVCDIELSWRAGLRANHYSVTGTDGFLRIDDDRVTAEGPDGPRTLDLASPSRDQTHLDWFPPMFADFRQTLADPGRWHVPADEIAGTARVIETAYRSAAAGGAPLALDGDPSRPGLPTESPA